MNIWQSLSGRLTVEITTSAPERLFDELLQSEIAISCIQKQTDLTYQFQIFRKNYRRLSRITQKHGDSVSIIHRHGLYWTIRAAGKRPVLLCLIFLLSVLSVYLPSRVLLIEVSGNHAIPANQILEAASNCGIRFGAKRNHVRSEKVKNQLQSTLPQLQWAGINTAGCRAVISVRERTESEPEPDHYVVSNLIAEQDAYILSVTADSGTPMVQPGDAILKGQVLISGYTDCGRYIQATRASGEILAQTNRSLTAIMPANLSSIGMITDTKYAISVLIGKKRINLWKDSRISDTGCGRMYEEYFVSLPGGFKLPIAFAIDRFYSFTPQNSSVKKTDAFQSLNHFSDECLLRQMTAGKILHKQQSITLTEGVYMLKSDYICTEIIGMERREQIGDRNG